jgi:hypothetical protein
MYGRNPSGRGDAVHPRHRQVHQDDVRRVFGHQRERLEAVAGLPDDVEVRLRLELAHDATPHHRMAVDDGRPP